MSKTLSGVIAAIATPIEENGAPDLKRATELARYLLDNGCDGLNVLGTTGEATSFSLDQRKSVMNAYKAAGLPLDRLMVGTGAAGDWALLCGRDCGVGAATLCGARRWVEGAGVWGGAATLIAAMVDGDN